MNQQPEALRLADRNGNLIQQLRRTPMPLADLIPHLQAMGDELRRLHAENEALRNILRLCRPYMYEYASNTIDGAFDKLCETLDTEMKGQ